MEEVLVILIGAGIVALMPLVPALRPVVKTAVKGGLIVVGATKGATDVVGQHWREVVAQAKMEMQAGDHADLKTPSAVEAATEAGQTVKAGAEETRKTALAA